MRFAVGALAAAAILMGASGAQAAQRYAAPGGSGTECTPQAPCLLSEAITRASANDEVIVTAGTYSVGSPLAVPGGANDVDIHGDFGGTRPRIEAALTGPPIALSASGARLRFLEIVNIAASSPVGFYCAPRSEVDRVSVTAVGSGATAASVSTDSCIIRNSLLRADGQNASAFSASTSIGYITGFVHNVTAVATGSNSIGFRAVFIGISPGSTTLMLSNTIAEGEFADLQTSTLLLGEANIVATNSNFDQVDQTSGRITGSNNQTAPPLFVDAAAGNYREALGSPTIDTGTSAGLGPLDLDGNPRLVGAAPDIGAYEYVPPPPAAAPLAKLNWLKIRPKAFRPLNTGRAILSAPGQRHKKKRRAKIGGVVRYSLTQAAAVRFVVQRKLPGRKVGKRCRKPTRANRKRRKCARWRRLKGGLRHQGSAGVNRFKYTGRLSGKRLRPGRYRLVARVPGSVRRAGFRIVR